MSYLSMGADSPSYLVLHPLAMIQRGAVSYLVATAYDYDDIRLYAIHRVQQAMSLSDKVNSPKDFDLDQYIESGHLEFDTGKTLQFEAVVVHWLARILEEYTIKQQSNANAYG